MRMKWDTDRIVSISAMLVGVGSLFIVLYQTALLREQAKASVLPYLMIAYSSGDTGAARHADSGLTLQMLGSPNGTPMAGELLRTFAFVAVQDPVPSHGPTADALPSKAGAEDKAVLEIDYASVYGERWRVRSDRVVPEPL